MTIKLKTKSSRRLAYHLPADVHRRLKIEAAKKGLSMYKLGADIIDKGLKNYGK